MDGGCIQRGVTDSEFNVKPAFEASCPQNAQAAARRFSLFPVLMMKYFVIMTEACGTIDESLVTDFEDLGVTSEGILRIKRAERASDA